MALIECPECGKENVSSAAAACPNCGYDLRSHFQRIERESQEKTRKEKAEENLRAMREAEEQEYFRKLDSIPEPLKYGKIYVYVILGVAGLLCLAGGEYLLTVICAVAAAVYWYQSTQTFKRYIADPGKYREEELRKQNPEQQAAGFGSGSGAGIVIPSRTVNGKLFCPVCGSEDISQQVFQENLGSRTITQTTSKYKEAGHGCLWWLLIGWWWWIVDVFLWIFAFWPRLMVAIFVTPFKKKKYKGKETSVTETVNDVAYRTVCTCKNCGHTW